MHVKDNSQCKKRRLEVGYSSPASSVTYYGFMVSWTMQLKVNILPMEINWVQLTLQADTQRASLCP